MQLSDAPCDRKTDSCSGCAVSCFYASKVEVEDAFIVCHSDHGSRVLDREHDTLFLLICSY